MQNSRSASAKHEDYTMPAFDLQPPRRLYLQGSYGIIFVYVLLTLGKRRRDAHALRSAA